MDSVQGSLLEGKVCNRCGQWYPMQDFHKQKQSRDGRRNHCKDCRYKAEKDRMLEARKTGGLASLHSTKKGGKGTIQPFKGTGTCLTICTCQPGIDFAVRRQAALLFDTRNLQAMLKRSFSLIKRIIIQSAMRAQQRVHGCFLLSVWVGAIAKCFDHDMIMLSKKPAVSFISGRKYGGEPWPAIAHLTESSCSA